MDRTEHWNQVYRTKGPDQVSWYQPEAKLSRLLIARVAPQRDARILDAGAGASMLTAGLVADGYRNITVVDIAEAALSIARERLGKLADRVTWVNGDILSVNLPPASVDVWHDRAVFHFLTAPADRDRYLAQVRRTVTPGGIVLVATFADDGPVTCSGLDVVRYSTQSLHAAFGAEFTLLDRERELHHTPTGGTQAFTYCSCRFDPGSGHRTAA